MYVCAADGRVSFRELRVGDRGSLYVIGGTDPSRVQAVECERRD